MTLTAEVEIIYGLSVHIVLQLKYRVTNNSTVNFHVEQE